MSDGSKTDPTGGIRGSSATGRVLGQRVLRPRQQVEERIRALILRGKLTVGERLPPETEIARQFDVSRTTVREALRSLTTQGLISKTPGARGGSYVQSVDHKSLSQAVADSMQNLLLLGTIDFEEVATVRELLEVPAAQLAAAHRTEEHLNELRRIVAHQKAATVQDAEISRLDAEFHGTIADASGNRVLAAFVHAVHQHTEPVHYLDLSEDVGRSTVRQHQAILDALAAGDSERAGRATQMHLDYLREHVYEQTRAG